MSMEPDRWRRIETLFRRSLQQPAEDRRAYLESQNAEDPLLIAQVLSLLEADDEVGDLLDQPPPLPGPDADPDAGPDAGSKRSRERIGPYRLVETLGEGGMSTVYLAVRDDDAYERRVALKVIRREAVRFDLLQRFLVERQILASLEHSYIARLFGGDATEDGRPYFVLEHIEGEPLDVYCDRRRLGLEERIALLRRVCEAVHHAHRHLVVHRDLKPANILVTEEGIPKLLDFGIAKILEPRVFPRPVDRTRTGLRPMTPLYASPEQIRGEPVTTASDVYALGVLLYRLLAGCGPYRASSRAPHEIERAIEEESPIPPSVAVRDPAALGSARGSRSATPESVAAARSVSPRTLRRRLEGDLDNIVLTALRKEPERRYASALELAEDLDRFLDGRPVRARRDTFPYRAGKLVRRHRIGVAMAAVLLLLIVGFAAAMAVQAMTIARERDAARLERDKAWTVADFLRDTFTTADPGESLGEPLTAREILDRGAERIPEELADQPELQATLMTTIGTVYTNLGLYDEAESLLRHALDIRRDVLDPDDPVTAESLSQLAELRFHQGRVDDALPLVEEARQILESRPEPDPRRLGEVINSLAAIHFLRGDLDGAEPLYRQALALQRRRRDEEPGALATTLGNFAVLMQQRGDLPAAEALFREALEIRRQQWGDEHPEIAFAIANLATNLHEQGKMKEAEVLHRQALAMRRKIFGDDHPEVAQSLLDLASNLDNQGEYAAAEPLFREALEIQLRHLGPEHPHTLVTRNNLGMLLRNLGRTAEAEEELRRAAEGRRKALGANHPDLALTLLNLGNVLVEQRKLEAAEPVLQEALQINRQALGDRNFATAQALEGLARLRRLQGRTGEQEALLRESLAIHRETLGEDHLYTATSLTGLGELLLERGEPDEAEPLLRRALRIRREQLPEGHLKLALTRSLLGACRVAQGRYAEAEELLIASQPVIRDAPSATPAQKLAVLERLVELYRSWGKQEEAARWQERLAATTASPESPGTAAARGG
jgi:serine/threonine protein kinase/Tfp pilus assembly protein PilF